MSYNCFCFSIVFSIFLNNKYAHSLNLYTKHFYLYMSITTHNKALTKYSIITQINYYFSLLSSNHHACNIFCVLLPISLCISINELMPNICIVMPFYIYLYNIIIYLHSTSTWSTKKKKNNEKNECAIWF